VLEGLKKQLGGSTPQLAAIQTLLKLLH